MNNLLSDSHVRGDVCWLKSLVLWVPPRGLRCKSFEGPLNLLVLVNRY